MAEEKEFLQSEEWLRFQAVTGKETLPVVEEGVRANGIVHILPFVGKYLYVPRGPRADVKQQASSIKLGMQQLLLRAQEKKVKWIRIEPDTEALLQAIQQETGYPIVKAPHDMQPRAVLKVDLSLSEADLLAGMKSKTRYNIRLAEKHGVRVFETREKKYQAAFLDLITATAGRKGIAPHPRPYYAAFFQALPKEMWRLFVAEYQGVVLCANLVIFYGDTATYLHGGSSDQHRASMAPHLLQWEQMRVAKKAGFNWYDFGGVKTEDNQSLATNEKKQSRDTTDWAGITAFKRGFSPHTAPTVFPGSYDIILNTKGYRIYNLLRKPKSFFASAKRKMHL